MGHTKQRHSKKFNRRRCDTVILAFDDSANVPRAKAITQAQRRRTLPTEAAVPPDFSADRDPLPEAPPMSWASAMSNREFKRRVQMLLCEAVPEQARPPFEPGHEAPFRLIIDWRGDTAQVFEWDGRTGTPIGTHTRPRPAIGEADLKVVWWAKKQSGEEEGEGDGDRHRHRHHMLVDATDGDYVMIGLLMLAGQGVNDEGGDDDNNTESSSAEAAATTPINMSILRRSGGGGGGGGEGVEESKREWLSLNLLHHWLKTNFIGPDLDDMRALVVLVALTGTDYTRNLPLIGPKKFTQHRTGAFLRRCLREVRSYVMADGELDADALMRSSSLITSVYAEAYDRHLPPGLHCPSPSSRITYTRLLAALRQAPKLSPLTRGRFASVAQIRCTLRNAAFLLHYWGMRYSKSEDHDHERMRTRFGFRLMMTIENGEGQSRQLTTEWADEEEEEEEVIEVGGGADRTTTTTTKQNKKKKENNKRKHPCNTSS